MKFIYYVINNNIIIIGVSLHEQAPYGREAWALCLFIFLDECRVLWGEPEEAESIAQQQSWKCSGQAH